MRKLILAFLLSACSSHPPNILPGTTPEIRQDSEWLQEELGVSAVVEVRDALLLEAGLYGSVFTLGEGYVILLDPRLDARLKQLVLAHEWAHILRLEAGDRSGRHDAAWGVAFALIHRVWTQEPGS